MSFQSTFESYYYIKLHHCHYLVSDNSFIMAFYYNSQRAHLSHVFEAKARGVFQIPTAHYITNDELKFYWDILQGAADDGEARVARALACGTNPNCRCYACQQAEDRVEDSTVSSLGAEADDEWDTTLQSAATVDSEASLTWGTYSYYNTSQPPASPDPSASGSSHVASSLLNSTVASSADNPGDSSKSVISISDETSVEVISISSEADQTAINSPPLPDLVSLWNSTFRTSGNISDTVNWESSPPRKRRRLGLRFGSFQGHHGIKTKSSNQLRGFPVDLSPIPHHTKPQHTGATVWKQEANHETDQGKHRL